MNTPRFLTLEKLTSENCPHPRKTVVPVAVGLAWRRDGAVYQEKIDGVFTLREFGGGPMMSGGALLAGDTLPGGKFIAWDCLAFDGSDLRDVGTWERLSVLASVRERFGVWCADCSPHGGQLLQDVLARGGEGVVRKLPGATYFEPMQAAKRVQTWQCVVTALDYGTGGARIADVLTGEDRGTVPLRNRVSACRVGSVVKVEGMELTAAGKIREPRPCKDTPDSWLVSY